MEKGKVIWILYNNCLYCSEVEKFCIGSPDKDHITIHLNPIIGNIDLIMLLRGQAAFDFIIPAYFHFRDGSNFPWNSGFISCNFDRICSHIS